MDLSKRMVDFKISAIGIVSEPSGLNSVYAVVLMHAWRGVLSEDATKDEILAAGPPLAEAETHFCLN